MSDHQGLTAFPSVTFCFCNDEDTRIDKTFTQFTVWNPTHTIRVCRIAENSLELKQISQILWDLSGTISGAFEIIYSNFPVIGRGRDAS